VRYEPETEDADVARVEEVLAAASNPEPRSTPSHAKPIATHATWFCACVSEDAPPSDVRHWLDGEEDPWGSVPRGDVFGDPTVLPLLGRRIRGS
jgi:hypothetical protein